MVRNYVKKGCVRYPFREWFKKKSFKLIQGVDFHCHTYSLVQQLRNAAKLPKYHKRLSINVSKDAKSLTVHVRERSDDDD